MAISPMQITNKRNAKFSLPSALIQSIIYSFGLLKLCRQSTSPYVDRPVNESMASTLFIYGAAAAVAAQRRVTHPRSHASRPLDRDLPAKDFTDNLIYSFQFLPREQLS